MKQVSQFHLSIGVRSLAESVEFFEHVLKASVRHRDASGYVNLDVCGCQITLQENANAAPDRGLHFGVNLDLDAFETLANGILAAGRIAVVMPPAVADAGTPMERRKMYVRCPTGYLVEIKGYRQPAAAHGNEPATEHRRIWRYRVDAEKRDDFMRHYGDNGTWTDLFRRAAGYRGTELWRDARDETIWYTQDRWLREADFLAFMDEHRDAYQQMDRQLDNLTLEETFLGAMHRAG